MYLEPKYDSNGKRSIVPQNIMSSNDLERVLNDINLVAKNIGNKVNVYCEDRRAADFVRFVLASAYNVNLGIYMDFIDINLGWTNYIQLYEKHIPEFMNNIIVLDGDVIQNKGYRNKSSLVNDSKNIIILPLVIEKDMFVMLKQYHLFEEFLRDYSPVDTFSYDICFRDWPLDVNQYETIDFKNWYQNIEEVLGNQEILFKYWCDKNRDKVNSFINEFSLKFNSVAEIKDADELPPLNDNVIEQNNN